MKLLLSIVVSLVILAALYTLVDSAAIFAAIAKTDPALLGLSLLLLVGLIFISAFRLHLLARYGDFALSGMAAVQATFAANALNMFLPGKLGDLLKAVMMAERAPQRTATALALGVWEKLSDLALLFLMAALPLAILGDEPPLALGLGLCGIIGILALTEPRLIALPLSKIGLLTSFARSWHAVLDALRAHGKALPILFLLTAVIWMGHLLQITLMVAALRVEGPLSLWVTLIALFPVAIVAGLVPLTFAGVGIRDAALVLLLSPYIGTAAAAALGLLFLLRYLVPGLLGSPLLPRFLDLVHARAKAMRK